MHTFVLRVVNRATGRAVPNAEVLYLPANLSWGRLPFAERIHADRLWSGPTEAFFERYGAIKRTDAGGRVRLQLAENNRRFLARNGQTRGELLVQGALPFAEDSSQHEIALERQVSVEVQAVDPDGRPQPGIPLSVTFGETDHGRSYYADGPDARVRIYKPLGLADNEDWRMITITPRIFGAQAKPTRFDMLAANQQPVRVECPPTGRLLVTLPDGAHPSTYRKRLALISSIEAQPSGRVRDGGGMWAIGTALPTGDFLFPFVALGQEFTPIAPGPATLARIPAALPGGIQQRSFAGPQVPGATARVTLKKDTDAPLLCAVLLDGSGKRRANQGVHVAMEIETSERGYDKVFHLSTDAHGRFELPLPRYFHSTTPRSLLISVVDHDNRKTGPAKLVRSPTFGLGKRADLGEVTISLPAPLVTLDLRRRDGRSISARHHFQTRQTTGAGPATWVDTVPEFREVLADGRLAYYSHNPATKWRVVFWHPLVGENDPNAFASSVEFEPGHDTLEVVQDQRRR